MQPYQIVLLILLIVIFLYILLLFFVLSHVFEFNNRMNKKLRAMNILLSEKAQLLQTIGDDFASMKVSFNEGDKEIIESLSMMKFDKSKYEEVCANSALIDKAYKRLSFLSSTNVWATRSETYIESRSLLDDIDKNFRQCSVLYNGDLITYNYWITIPGTRLLVRLFGFKKGKQVS